MTNEEFYKELDWQRLRLMPAAEEYLAALEEQGKEATT